MNIIWAPNPLATVIELDDADKERLRLKLHIEDLQERLYSAYFAFDPWFRKTHSEWSGKPDTLEAAVEESLRHLTPHLTPPSDDGYVLEEGAIDDYIEALRGLHDGDCVCQACSCLKCRAEGFLGIDTMAGLGKHEASTIGGTFREGLTIDEVLLKLADYEPVRTGAWKRYPESDFEAHVPRWREEGKRAHAWLTTYRRERFGT